MRTLGILLLAAFVAQLPAALDSVGGGRGAVCGHVCCRRLGPVETHAAHRSGHCAGAGERAAGSDCRISGRCSLPAPASAGTTSPWAVLIAGPRSWVPPAPSRVAKTSAARSASLYDPEPPTPPPRLLFG